MRSLTVSIGVFAVSLAASLPARAADPTTADCLAANNSAIELRNEHKLRAARGQLLICSSGSCPADVRKECLRRVDEVNVQIPTVVFETKDSFGRDIGDVKVTMDGQPLADRIEGSALSVDPGEHAFTFETAGHPAVKRQFVILESQKDRRESIVFDAPLNPSGAVPMTGAQAPSLPPSPSSPEPSRGLGAQKTWALVAAGVGVAGVGLGAAFGLSAISKRNDAQAACPHDCADQSGVNKWSDAKTAGNLSTVAFALGAAGLVAGAALWFTAKPGSDLLQLAIGPGSAQVRATF